MTAQAVSLPTARPHPAGLVRAALLLWDFGVQEALSCLFPVFVFAALGISQLVAVPGVPRYDVLLLACLAIQAVMVATGLETRDELKVICVFHLIGLALEVFKVRMGSWAYPEAAYSKFFGVPLYSGFMYASVASYMCQSWRRLDLALSAYPGPRWTVPLAAAGYLNFFTHHYLPDVRWPLIGLVFVMFLRARVAFTVRGERLWMPLALSFFLIGLFVWLAENVATLLGAWQYPNQREHWAVVHPGKITSWFLLVIVSFLIVAQLKHLKEGRRASPPSGRSA
jgi:uncharacterized membrane protein YoaT (DUF817 family)